MLIYRGKRFNTVVRFIILTIVVSCPLTICPRFGLCKDAVEKPSTAFEGLTTAPWRSGEKAVYSISMSGIEIAIARTSIGAFDSDRIVARVASETLPSFSNILRVKDDISSWILLDGLMPERSEIHAIYKKNESRTYNELTRTKAGIRLKQRIAAWLPSKNSALEKKKRTWKTATRYPTLLHDPVSLLLNLRHKVLKTGERYSYFVMSGRKKYLVVLNVQGNETIYLNGRAVKTMRLLGTMQRTSGARKLSTWANENGTAAKLLRRRNCPSIWRTSNST